MGSKSRAHHFGSVAALIAVLLAIVLWSGPAAAIDRPEPAPLQNLGFELGVDGLDHWEIDPLTPAGNVTVVRGADPSAVFALTGISVAPWDSAMLRMGVPKDGNSHQVKGVNRISQSFMSDGRDIILSFRIFTWEHRANDAFVVDLKNEKGESVGQLSEKTVAGVTSTATWLGGGPLPYEVFLQVDRKEKYTDSGWVEVQITDVPAAEVLTLSYTLDLSSDSAHDTWMYIDRRNVPPEPLILFSPDPDHPQIPEQPHEGDAVGMYGLSVDADSSAEGDVNDIATWSWRVSQAGRPEVAEYEGPYGFIVPHDEGEYQVKLTITDFAGVSATTSRTLPVQSYAPRVNALDVEALPGMTVGLAARFLDSGWMDEHTVSWGINTTEANLQEDNFAALSSGLATARLHVPGTATADMPGTAAVSDEAVTGEDAFTVRLTTPEDVAREPNDSFSESTGLRSDTAYLSFIEGRNDVDIFEILLPDGGAPPYGSEILVTLRDLPADYDLAIVQEVGPDVTGVDDVQDAPFMNSPFMNSPFMNSPFMNSPFMNSPFMNSPFMNSPFMNSPFMNSPFMNSPAMHSPFMNSPFMNSPFMNSPFMNSPFMNSPFMNSPFMNSPFMNSPFMNSPFMNSPFMNSPFLHGPDHDLPIVGQHPLDGYPLSALSFTGRENNKTSGIDIDFSELGLDGEELAAQGMQVAGFSASSGLEAEVVLVPVQYVGTKTYAIVTGADEAWSPAPYTLQVETSEPLDYVTDADGDALVDEPTYIVGVPVPGPTGPPLTLFVTQTQRINALYGANTWETKIRTTLEDVAGLEDVRGKVISLPSAIYDDADRQPWNVERNNALTSEIRRLVQQELANNLTDGQPSIEYVVILGGDEVVPFRRTPDYTIVGNELYYAGESFLKGDSPLRASMEGSEGMMGNILTDDFLVDAAPITDSAGLLYVPDVSVSRLVETPAEIAGSLAAFLDDFTNGRKQLQNQTAVVSGHDFMADGIQVVDDIFTRAGMMTELLGSEDWTGQQLKDSLILGNKDVGSLNAHYTHYAGLSAAGYGMFINGLPWTMDEFLLSQDLAAAGGGSFFANKLVFSMGCHAGFNAPDKQVVDVGTSYPINPALDLPQALMRHGSVYVGSTGYAYGEKFGIAGTEALIGFFADELVKPGDGVTGAEGNAVGPALAQAKRNYIGSLAPGAGVYDSKSSMQFTMYGMPHYRMPAAETTALASVTGSGSFESAGIGERTATDGGDFDVSIVGELTQEGLAAGPHSFDLTSYSVVLPVGAGGGTGTFYTATEQGAGSKTDSLVLNDRPIQPRAVIPLLPSDEGPAHGMIYSAGTFEELAEAYNPAIARMTMEWELQEYGAEQQVSPGGWWPAQPAFLSTIETPSGTEQRAVFVPGQFRRDTAAGESVTGTERIWRSLEVELLRSNSDDYMPATVADVDLWMTDDGVSVSNEMTVSVDANDASGVRRIVVLQLTDSGMEKVADQSFTGGQPNGTNGRYEQTYTTTLAPDDVSLLIQVVDGTNNVTTLTGKGATLTLPVEAEPLTVNIQPTGPYSADVPTLFGVQVPGATSALAYFIEHGDGTTSEGLWSGYVTEVPGFPQFESFFFNHQYSSYEGPLAGRIVVRDTSGREGIAYFTVEPAVVFLSPQGDDQAGNGGEASPWQSIQKGIDEVVAGGTVQLDEGTFYESVDLKSDITVKGQGSGSTFVDGAEQQRAIFNGKMINDVFVTDLTVESGAAGGFYVIDDLADPGLTSPLQNELTLSDLVVQNNTAASGGGIWTRLTHLTMQNVQFLDNTASGSGGAVHPLLSSLVIRNSELKRNSAGNDGGAIRLSDSTLLMESSRLVENTAGSLGGGLAVVFESSAKIANSIIAQNSAPSGGGIGAGAEGALTIINSTIADNVSVIEGGGLWTQGASASIFNSILWNNGDSNIYFSGDVVPEVAYSDVQQGDGQYPGVGNINGDPWFLDPAVNDYRIGGDSIEASYSPCMDVGATDYQSNQGLLEAPEVDIEGVTRPQGLRPDMGAHEIPHSAGAPNPPANVGLQ